MRQTRPSNPADDQPGEQTLAPANDLPTAVAPAAPADQPGLVGRALNDLMQDVLSAHAPIGDKSTILSADAIHQHQGASNGETSLLSVDETGVQRIGGTRV